MSESARIHVLLARKSPLAVVIRRGPSKRVATLLWDRRTDELTVGQWLNGRIYERRSDLSPDGKYLIYFALNGHWDSESKGSWTAVSRAPYLRAIAMFPKGDGWHGGGLWTGERRYWLNDGWGHERLRATKEVQRDTKFVPHEDWGGECPGVYYLRLQRDGWTLLAENEHGPDVFERALGHGFRLRKLAHAGSGHGKSVYWDSHELIDADGRVEAQPDWEWADLDGGRLAWSTGGKIFAASLFSDGPGEPRELADLNPLEFERLEAPYE